MTTMDVPGPREYMGMWLVNVARNRKRAKAADMQSATMLAFVRVVLHLAGFALLTIAAFSFNIIAGFAVAGISCFVFSTLLSGGNVETPRSAPDLRTGR